MKVLCSLLARDVRLSDPVIDGRSYGEIGLDLIGVFHIVRADTLPVTVSLTVVVILQAEPDDQGSDYLLHIRIVDEYGQPLYRTDTPFVVHPSTAADPLTPLPASLTLDGVTIAHPGSYIVEVLGNGDLVRQLSLQVI
jgi:hypothetical protein